MCPRMATINQTFFFLLHKTPCIQYEIVGLQQDKPNLSKNTNCKARAELQLTSRHK
uniref:Uncharacterized protein n=1 Tax=Anguilla anguilla TaxID=7936 RepID=A0A0E9QEV8_ANGAN